MFSAGMILWVLAFPAILPGGEAEKEASGPWLGQRGQSFYLEGIDPVWPLPVGGAEIGPNTTECGNRFRWIQSTYGEAAGNGAEEFDVRDTLGKSVLLCGAMDSIAADSSEQPAPQAPSQKEEPLEDKGEMEEASEGEEEIEVASEEEVDFVGGFFCRRALNSMEYTQIGELPREDMRRRLEPPAVIYHLAKFDLGKITEKDAVDWAILKLTPEEITIEELHQRKELRRFRTKQEEETGTWSSMGFVKVRWKRIASLLPSARQKEEGTAIWRDSRILRGVCLLSLYYYPTDHGGVVLAKYNPEAKIGENPFQRIVVVGEEMAQWIPAAYQFRLKHAELFGKEFHEAKLVHLLQHENPMIAIQAAQRLAKEKRLLGKPLAAALEGPADFRRPVIIYIACLSQTIKTSEEGAKDLSGKPLQKGDVPPELQAAIRKADPKMLRWYVMALCGVCVNREKDIKMRLPLGALQLCQQRAKELPLDQDQRKELELLLECAEFRMNIYFPAQKSE